MLVIKECKKTQDGSRSFASPIQPIDTRAVKWFVQVGSRANHVHALDTGHYHHLVLHVFMRAVLCILVSYVYFRIM